MRLEITKFCDEPIVVWFESKSQAEMFVNYTKTLIEKVKEKTLQQTPYDILERHLKERREENEDYLRHTGMVK